MKLQTKWPHLIEYNRIDAMIKGREIFCLSNVLNNLATTTGQSASGILTET